MVAEEGFSVHAPKAQRGIQTLGARILPIDNKAHALMSLGKDLDDRVIGLVDSFILTF